MGLGFRVLGCIPLGEPRVRALWVYIPPFVDCGLGLRVSGIKGYRYPLGLYQGHMGVVLG